MGNAYLDYAKAKLPTGSSELDNAVSEYLKFRLSKKPPITVKAWEVVIDELVAGLHLEPISVTALKKKNTRVRTIGKEPDFTSLDELIYMFQVATIRRWNHVYFTPEQDKAWDNISFYQDPYWHELVSKKATRKLLEEVLRG